MPPPGVDESYLARIIWPPPPLSMSSIGTDMPTPLPWCQHHRWKGFFHAFPPSRLDEWSSSLFKGFHKFTVGSTRVPIPNQLDCHTSDLSLDVPLKAKILPSLWGLHSRLNLTARTRRSVCTSFWYLFLLWPIHKLTAACMSSVIRRSKDAISSLFADDVVNKGVDRVGLVHGGD